MRRLFLAGLLVTIGFIGVQGIAHAQTVPYDPGPPSGEVGGIVVNRPAEVGGASVGREQLAFTGSNHTDLYVGVGVALVLLGTALLIATARRRRSEIAIDA